MKKKFKNIISVFFLYTCAWLFFIKLFWPKPALFFTPDLGRSDIVHMGLPKKFLLSQALNNHQLPLWTTKIGTGVSLIGEGQIGTFNVINFILFQCLPLVTAWNLTYVFSSFIALLGTFVLARHFKFSYFTAIFIALVFSFSGFFIFRLSHQTVFMSAAFLPLIFYFSLKLFERNKLKDALILALLIAQQAFLGHPQIPFITVFGCLIFLVFIVKVKHQKLKTLVPFLLTLIFVFFLTAIQLLPQLELKTVSVRQKGLSFSQTTDNSLSPKFLLTFLYPYFFGNPSKGTYPLYQNGQWDVFWEKIAYLGIIPFILSLIGFFSKDKSQQIYKKAFIFLLVIALLLAFGKYSPLFFLYFLPPFNFFRAPSRYILLINFALSFLAGIGLESLLLKAKQKHFDPYNLAFLKILLMLFIFIPRFLISSNYHPLVSPEKLMEKPEAALFLAGKPGRVYQLGSGFPYLQNLFKQGWQDVSYFFFAKNSLDADANILYGIDQTNIYDSILTSRQETIQSLLRDEAKADFTQMTATSSALQKKILSLTNSQFIISPFKIKDPDLPLTKTVFAQNQTCSPFYIYENKNVLPRIRIVSDYQSAVDEEQALQLIKAENFDPDKTAVLENAPVKTLKTPTKQKIKMVKDEDQKLIIETLTDQESILLLADSFYPGWHVLVDNKYKKIYPANINQKAIFLPEGIHQIEFFYNPPYFKIGTIISLSSATVLLILFLLSISKGRIKCR